MRHRRLDPETFQALQALMSSDGVRVGPALANAIGERREDLGLSLVAVAEAIGVEADEMERIEHGEAELSASAIVRLAQALDVDLVWFVERESSFLAGRVQADPLALPEAFPATQEGLQLMHAFASIADPSARRAVLELARKLAAGDGREDEDKG